MQQNHHHHHQHHQQWQPEQSSRCRRHILICVCVCLYYIRCALMTMIMTMVTAMALATLQRYWQRNCNVATSSRSLTHSFVHLLVFFFCPLTCMYVVVIAYLPRKLHLIELFASISSHFCVYQCICV